MGSECSNTNKKLFFLRLIERKLQNRISSIDMKIHNEYLYIIGFNNLNYQMDQV